MRSGYCNKNNHKLGGVKNKLVFFTVLEAEKCKVKVWAEAPSQGLPPHLKMAPSCCVLTRREGNGAPWGLFYKDIISFMGCSPR